MDTSGLFGDLLECSVCLEPLGHRHKVLPCQHTFCIGCLEDIIQKKNELCCPECRTPVPTELSIHQLPSNVILNRILESLKSQQQPKHHSGSPLPTSPPPPPPPSRISRSRQDAVNNNTTSRQAPVSVSARVSPPPSKPPVLSPSAATPIGKHARAGTRPTPPAATESPSMSPTGSAATVDIPGNLDTNPFMEMLQMSTTVVTVTTTSIAPSSPIKCSTSTSASPGQPTMALPLVSSLSSVAATSTAAASNPAATTSGGQLLRAESGGFAVSPESPLPTLPPKPVFARLAGPARPPATPPPSNAHPPTSPPPQPPPQPPAKAIGVNNTNTDSVHGKKLRSGHQIYRALYDYMPVKSDELLVRKNELYIVTEKCRDGWFKGSSVLTLKTGFFPGNYVEHVSVTAAAAAAHKHAGESHEKRVCAGSQPSADSAGLTTDKSGSSKPAAVVLTTSTEPDLIDFNDWNDVFSTTKTIVPPNVTTSWSFPTRSAHDRLEGAAERLRAAQPAAAASAAAATGTTKHNASAAAAVREKYRCTIAFPASSQFELDLKEGDVIFLSQKRDDGWCKGTLARTGQKGLFPASFVERL